MGRFSITLHLVEISYGIDLMLTRVYGPSSLQNLSGFWDELLGVRRRWVGPWVIGGDFNVIRSFHEKNN